MMTVQDLLASPTQSSPDGKHWEPEQPSHCEAGPEFCQQCQKEAFEDRSLALAAAFRYIKNHTPHLVWTEIERALQKQPAQQEPVAFLANGTRFKMSFFENEDGPGTHVTCFEAFEKELDGRWVALVAAEDDCHRSFTRPPAREWVELTEEERTEIRREHYARTLPLMDAVESKLREKNA